MNNPVALPVALKRKQAVALKRKQAGLTLIELLIAVTLGAVVLAGTVSLFQQSKSSSVQDEQIARMQENGRFALRALTGELSMMGFWAGVTNTTLIDVTNASVGSDDCATAPSWMLDTSVAIEFTNDITVSPYLGCIATADIVPDTDVISIKRVADQPDMTTDNLGQQDTGEVVDEGMYLETDTVAALLYEASSTSSTSPTVVPDGTVSRYLPAVFYVRPCSDCSGAGDGVPTLVRETLVQDDMVAQPMVEGIENLQIEFGVDGTDTDLAADYYVPNLAETVVTAAHLNNAVTARVFLLVRSVNPIPGYTNDKSYNLGTKVVAAANDSFYRRVYTGTVQMRNADKLKLYALD